MDCIGIDEKPNLKIFWIKWMLKYQCQKYPELVKHSIKNDLFFFFTEQSHKFCNETFMILKNLK